MCRDCWVRVRWRRSQRLAQERVYAGSQHHLQILNSFRIIPSRQNAGRVFGNSSFNLPSIHVKFATAKFSKTPKKWPRMSCLLLPTTDKNLLVEESEGRPFKSIT